MRLMKTHDLLKIADIEEPPLLTGLDGSSQRQSETMPKVHFETPWVDLTGIQAPFCWRCSAAEYSFVESNPVQIHQTSLSWVLEDQNNIGAFDGVDHRCLQFDKTTVATGGFDLEAPQQFPGP